MTLISDHVSIVKVQTGAFGASVMTLVSHGVTGAMVFTPSSVGRTAGASHDWSQGGIYSMEGYTRGAFVSFRMGAGAWETMVGLNSDPALDANYTSIDYAWFPYTDGTLQIYENGVFVATFGTWTTSTVLAIMYDGVNVSYLKDGVVQRTVPRAIGNPLHLDSAFFRPLATAQVVDLAFGPVGEQGAPATTVLAQPNSMAAVGGRVIIGPTTKLAADLAAATTSLSVESAVFSNGDRVLLQKVVSGVQQTEFLAITSAASGSGPFSYNVTRNLDASDANDWKAGDVVTSTGQTGSGFIDLYSARGLKDAAEVGPTIAFNVRNSSTWNDWTPRAIIGNLKGLFGYVVDIFGAVFGVPTGPWLKIDPTNGIRIGHNATTKVQVDAAGNASFSGAVTAGSGTIGGWAIGTSTLSSGGIKFDSTNGIIAIGSPHQYNNAATKFYADDAGRVSFGQKLLWDGTNLEIFSYNTWLGSHGISVAQNGIGGRGYLFSSSGNDIGGVYGESDKIVIKKSGVGNGAFEFGGVRFTANGADIHVTGSGRYVSAPKFLDGNLNQVLGTRGAAIADANGTLADLTTKFNTLLARFRASTGHGSIDG